MPKKKASERTEELICIDSFVQHLLEIDGGKDITYCKETKDPPDFWVCIEGVKYAVEVTDIVTDADYYAWFKRLTDDISFEYRKNNTIRGTYGLRIEGKPELPKRNTTEYKTLVLAAVSRIQEMSNVSCQLKSHLIGDTNNYLELEKFSDQGSLFGHVIIPTRYTSSVHEDLIWLFRKRIEAKKVAFDNKRKRLEKEGILNWAPIVILLLYDAYLFCDIEDVKKAFLNVHYYDWLHSIYFAASFSDTPNKLYPTKPGRKGVFLYSRNNQWH
jgi:hypothetical protein